MGLPGSGGGYDGLEGLEGRGPVESDTWAEEARGMNGNGGHGLLYSVEGMNL
jgi:hypothetical protein